MHSKPNLPPLFSLPVFKATSGNASDVPVDFLVRIQSDEAGVAVGAAHTRTVADALHSRMLATLESFVNDSRRAQRVLGEVIDSLKQREEFNAHHRDFLLGQLSEEEFESFAKEIAYHPVAQPPESLSYSIHVLAENTTSSFTASELADLFRARREDVDAAMDQLRLPLERVAAE